MEIRTKEGIHSHKRLPVSSLQWLNASYFLPQKFVMFLNLLQVMFTFLPCTHLRSVSKQEIVPPSHVVERYIELLCRYQPEGVYNFVRSNDNYRLEEALDVSIIAHVHGCILSTLLGGV